MKYLLILLLFFLTTGCLSIKEPISTNDENFSLKDEMNKSIIEGFYNGDTTGISNKIYLLK